MGKIKYLPLDVFYNPLAILNIFSFADVAAKFRIAMDTDRHCAMVVHIIPMIFDI